MSRDTVNIKSDTEITGAMEPAARTNTVALSETSVDGVNSNGRRVILTKGDRKKKDSLFRTTLSPRFLIMRDTIT